MTNIRGPIYLDNHATTPMDDRVSEKMVPYFHAKFGNASGLENLYSYEAQIAITAAKKEIAFLANCHPNQVIFTSGATESLNMAIQGMVRRQVVASPHVKPEIVYSPVEHKAVIETCLAMQRLGLATVTSLTVDQHGFVDLDEIKAICSRRPALLCVMAANNEIGTIQPVRDIASIAEQYSVPYLCDASQAVGRIDLNFRDWRISMLALSAHKLYGPKGVGALIVENRSMVEPLLYGGGQQGGMRAGTLNVSGIVGLGEACRLRSLEMVEDERAISVWRDYLQQAVVEHIPRCGLNGPRTKRLAGNLNITIQGVPSSDVLALTRRVVAISTGSACSSGASSHVLKAIGLTEKDISCSLRMGVGKFNTFEEMELVAMTLIEAVAHLGRSA